MSHKVCRGPEISVESLSCGEDEKTLLKAREQAKKLHLTNFLKATITGSKATTDLIEKTAADIEQKMNIKIEEVESHLLTCSDGKNSSVGYIVSQRY